MKREHLERKITDIVKDLTDPENRKEVTLDSKLDADLGLDSIDKVEFSMKLESRFHFKEKDDVWGDFLHEQDRTIRDVCDFVENRI